MPHARALLARLPRGTVLLGHSHLALSSRKLSVAGLKEHTVHGADAVSIKKDNTYKNFKNEEILITVNKCIKIVTNT
jgi:hypothetical protein